MKCVIVLTFIALFFIFTVYVNPTHGARVLGVFPNPGTSHVILAEALLTELARRGHNVTMVSSHRLSEPMKNYRDVVLKDTKNELWNILIGENRTEMFQRMRKPLFKSVNGFIKISLMLTKNTLDNENFQKILKEEKFDVVIIETFLNEALFGLAHHFGAPVITISSIPSTVWVNSLTGNIEPWSHVPAMLLGSNSDRMTFLQRTLNTLTNLGEKMFRYYYYLPNQEVLLKEYFKNAPDLQSLMINTSLVLLNSHVSLSTPRPLLPNMIEIGGFHVPPPKKLPDDLQKYMDEAKEGVIYFSMGSNLESKDLPIHIRNAILESLSKLKQKVIWKWEDDVLPGQPPNVKLGKWFPQADILAHSNLKLFITHGGLLSTTEAVMRGVPVVGIPIFRDQITNMKQAVNFGYGLVLEFENITSESFSSVLNEVLNNPKYTKVAKEISEILNDQPTKPLDRAVYWVEYVMRHKGANHLKSAAVHLSWHQYFLLDVILFLATTTALFIGAIYFTVRKIIIFIKNKKSKVD